MTSLLDAAQVEHVAVLLRHHEANHLGVEQSAGVEILDGQDRVAAARDVEGRVMVGARQFHHDDSFKAYWPSSSRVSPPCWRSSSIASVTSRPSRLPTAAMICMKFFGPSASASRMDLRAPDSFTTGGRGRRPLMRAAACGAAVTSKPILAMRPCASAVGSS